MRFVLAVAILVGCGSDHGRRIADATGAPLDAPAQRDAPRDAPPDAPGCTTFIASTSTATDVLSFTFSGGSEQSYGCAPIDPTYWMSGSGMSATITFVSPQSHPSLRVWGMNDDDTASVTVNGTPYSLDSQSAALSPKVVCGLSPGPDGMVFSAGNLTGANSNGAGNYSYQDVTIEQANVTSIQIAGLTGLGWGLAGASVQGCGTTQQ